MLAKTMQHSNFANIFDGFDWDFVYDYYIILHFCWHIAVPCFILPTKKVLTAFRREKMLATFRYQHHFDNITKKGIRKGMPV